MQSSSHVVAELSGGVTRITRIRSEPPILLRPTPQGLFLVGGAAGPLGGDDARLRIEVWPGARLIVRSTAATVALPGRDSRPSCLRIEATVARGAELHWLPEPTVLAGGCDHRAQAVLDVDASARLAWREELILGRHAEAPGSASSRLDCVVGGRPVLRNEQILGGACPGWDGPAVLGGAKAVGNLLVAAPEMTAAPVSPVLLAETAALMPLAGPAALVSALAPDSVTLRRYMDGALCGLCPGRTAPLTA